MKNIEIICNAINSILWAEVRDNTIVNMCGEIIPVHETKMGAYLELVDGSYVPITNDPSTIISQMSDGAYMHYADKWEHKNQGVPTHQDLHDEFGIDFSSTDSIICRAFFK